MASTVVTGPSVRVRRVPVSDPPYDDDPSTGNVVAGPPQPPLALPLTSGSAGDRGSTVSTAATGRSATAGTEPAGPPAVPARPAAASPATVFVATQFVNRCLEVLNGYRPPHHLRALATPTAARAVVAAMTDAVQRLRAASAGTRHRSLIKLRRMRTCEPRPDVAEIAVVLGPDPGDPGRPGQTWAMAYRLEHRQGRWLCAAAVLL